MEWVEKKIVKKASLLSNDVDNNGTIKNGFSLTIFFHSIFWGECFFKILNDRIGFSDHTMTIVLSKMTGRYFDKQPWKTAVKNDIPLTKPKPTLPMDIIHCM